KTGRRRLRIQAAIARPILVSKHRGLAFEAKNGAIHVRLLQQYAGVVHQVACRKIVSAVDNDVVILQDVQCILAREAGVKLVDPQVRIDIEHAIGGGVQFLAANVLGAMNDMPLEIRSVHDIKIDKANSADACGGQVQP